MGLLRIRLFGALLLGPASRLPFWTALRIHQVISFALHLTGLILFIAPVFPRAADTVEPVPPFRLALFALDLEHMAQRAAIGAGVHRSGCAAY
jgi:hypothetical protein